MSLEGWSGDSRTHLCWGNMQHDNIGWVAPEGFHLEHLQTIFSAPPGLPAGTHTHTCPVLSQLSSTNRGYCLLPPACYLVGRISADTSSFLPSSAIPSSSTYSQTRLRPEKCRGRGYYPSKQTEDRCSQETSSITFKGGLWLAERTTTA